MSWSISVEETVWRTTKLSVHSGGKDFPISALELKLVPINFRKKVLEETVDIYEALFRLAHGHKISAADT